MELRNLKLTLILWITFISIRVFGTEPYSNAAVSTAGECLSPSSKEIFRHPNQCPSPVDDETGRTYQSATPWTHIPSCISATIDINAKFCIFTDSTFGKYGVSLVTTPNIAANNIDLLYNFRDSSDQTYENDSPFYRIEEIPGKGKGMIADRLIPRHHTFLIDHAALIVNTAFTTDINRQKLLRQAVDQLREPQWVLELDRRNQETGLVDDILRTNAFMSELREGPHMILFPEVSRINHNCKPNSFLRYSMSGVAVGVAPHRDIQPGEEITISYLPLGLTYAERQQKAQNWGFRCQCEFCNSPATEVAASDARRDAVKHLKVEIAKALGQKKARMVMKLAKQTIANLEAEELPQLLAESYESLAWMHFLLGEQEAADAYANITLDILSKYSFLYPEKQVICAGARSLPGPFYNLCKDQAVGFQGSPGYM